MSSTEGGRTISGRVLTYGVIPPQAGPGRVQWCLEHGTSALELAEFALGRLLMELSGLIPDGLAGLPVAYPLEALHDEAYARRLGRRRVRQWFALRTRIEARDDNLELTSGFRVAASQGWLDAEALASDAVRQAAEALHCLREGKREASALPESVFPAGVLGQVVTATQGMTTRAHHCFTCGIEGADHLGRICIVTSELSLVRQWQVASLAAR